MEEKRVEEGSFGSSTITYTCEPVRTVDQNKLLYESTHQKYYVTLKFYQTSIYVVDSNALGYVLF